MSHRGTGAATLVAVVLMLALGLGACSPRSQTKEPAPSVSIAEEQEAEPPWSARLLLVGGGLLGGLLLGSGIGMMIGRRRSAAPTATPVPAALPSDAAPTPPPASSVPDDRLVAGLIRLDDLSDSAAVRSQVRTTLQTVGVTERPTAVGEPFDTTRHNAVGVEVCTDPRDHMTIARVVRPAWAGAAGTIRAADVEVYRYPGSP